LSAVSRIPGPWVDPTAKISSCFAFDREKGKEGKENKVI
jgi:hypothetical protein